MDFLFSHISDCTLTGGWENAELLKILHESSHADMVEVYAVLHQLTPFFSNTTVARARYPANLP
jgi:hypothetical protein